MHALHNKLSISSLQTSWEALHSATVQYSHSYKILLLLHCHLLSFMFSIICGLGMIVQCQQRQSNMTGHVLVHAIHSPAMPVLSNRAVLRMSQCYEVAV